MSSLPENLPATLTTAAYRRNADKWRTIRDALEGEIAIKSGNTRYLPMPSAMELAGAQESSVTLNGELFAHNNHTNKPYAAYKTRASFPEFTDATLRGIVGLILRNPSAYKDLPYDGMLEEATKDGKSLSELELHLNTEVMSLGRCGILADPVDGGMPKVVVYKTEDILYWQTKGSDENIKYTSVLLRDSAETEDFWLNDPNDTHHLLLIINDDGNYEVGRYKNEKLVNRIVPTVSGQPLKEIPFVTLGTIDLSPDIDSAPLWPLANLAVKIYQVDADLRNAQYMSCNPMLTLSGVDKEDIPAVVGSSVALVIEQDTGKAYYPKTDTSALDHVRVYIKDKQSEAIRLGANLLGNDNTLAESGEAIRLRQSMSAATVASVVATTGKGLQRLLRMIANWMKVTKTVEVLVNKEFSSFQMTANEQIALVQSWQSGILSSETTLENFRRAGMLHEGEDPQAELDRIKNDTHKFADLVNSNDESDKKGPDGGLPEGSQPNPAVKKAG
jgi:hypothetical protein